MNTCIKMIILMIALPLITAVLSFAEDNPNAENTPFNRIKRIDWNLAEVKNKSGSIVIDRSKAQREIYSMRFQEDSIRGRGADNLYFARYVANENNSLSIERIAGTLMLPIFEMENFKERDYFRYLERACRWEFHDWKLKLYTHDENNDEAIMEFIPIYK